MSERHQEPLGKENRKELEVLQKVLKHSMGSPEAPWSTLLAALLLDADISRAFFPGKDEEKQNTDGGKEKSRDGNIY